MKILGITGHAGHGKDTIADHLCAQWDFRRVSFAEPIDNIITALCGRSKFTMTRDEKENEPIWLGLTYRQLAQRLGNEAFKPAFGLDVWVKHFTETQWPYLQAMPQAGLVFSDVRFACEVDRIREEGGMIIKVIRPSYDIDLSHESERSIVQINPDITIANTSDVDALLDKTDAFAQAFLEGDIDD